MLDAGRRGVVPGLIGQLIAAIIIGILAGYIGRVLLPGPDVMSARAASSTMSALTPPRRAPAGS
jgi:hypothetical protein